ncbi:hypothetical protein AVEN_118516-1 [Araneus ventricosus]|uniref:Uncharacterized protein n=1 Tax=Araneus ventricosus TaxID=182803 RepID=A0A4Y2NNE9_ARAVE|nr:hypothetical protein AVEN_118516-1 [Araneus ventricosus]
MLSPLHAFQGGRLAPPCPGRNTPKPNTTFLFVFLLPVLYSSPPKFFLPSIAKKNLRTSSPSLYSWSKGQLRHVIKTPEKVLKYRSTPRIARNPEGGGQQVQSSALKMTEKVTAGENRNTINKTDRNKHSDIDFLLKQGFYGKHYF